MARKTYRTVYLTESRDKMLRKWASAEDISISKLVGKALDSYFGVNSPCLMKNALESEEIMALFKAMSGQRNGGDRLEEVTDNILCGD